MERTPSISDERQKKLNEMTDKRSEFSAVIDLYD
jgi:predicted CopG family antitoxin